MKELNEYLMQSINLSRSENILERLKIKKGDVIKPYYKYFPKDFNELRSLLEQLLDKRGEDADLNDIDVSQITTFYDPKSNKGLFEDLDPHNIDIRYWDVSNIVDASNMFYNCANFNCDLSNWNISKLSLAMFMFYGCSKFEGNGLNKWKFDNIKDIYNMFCDCKEFDCNLSYWDVSKVMDMRYMFWNCKNFKGKGLDKWKLNPSTQTRDMFFGCDSLKKYPNWYVE